MQKLPCVFVFFFRITREYELLHERGPLVKAAQEPQHALGSAIEFFGMERGRQRNMDLWCTGRTWGRLD